jgi:hypothetical protein
MLAREFVQWEEQAGQESNISEYNILHSDCRGNLKPYISFWFFTNPYRTIAPYDMPITFYPQTYV